MIRQGARHLGRIHEWILFYRKGESRALDMASTPSVDEYVDVSIISYVEPVTGRRFGLGDLTGAGGLSKETPRYELLWVVRNWRFTKLECTSSLRGARFPTRTRYRPRKKRYLDEIAGQALQDIWTDITPVQGQAGERVGYDTQKPEALLERITLASSDGRSRRRLLLRLGYDPSSPSGSAAIGSHAISDVSRSTRPGSASQRSRLSALRHPEPWVLTSASGGRSTGQRCARAYLDTILAFYRAEPIEGFVHLHGRKDGRVVHVGATDAPITIDETEDVMDEMADNGIEACDLLGWEWEMGLHDTIRSTLADAASTYVCVRSRARSWSAA